MDKKITRLWNVCKDCEKLEALEKKINELEVKLFRAVRAETSYMSVIDAEKRAENE